jgi:hypothetical protein
MKPLKFNDKVARGVASLNEAGKGFFKALDPLRTGQAAKAYDVQNAYRIMESALKDAKKDAKNMFAPRQSASGGRFLDAYVAYLGQEEAILQKHFSRIVKVVEDGSRNPAQQLAEIDRIIPEINSDEAQAVMPLRNVQTTFAKEQNFSLVSKK